MLDEVVSELVVFRSAGNFLHDARLLRLAKQMGARTARISSILCERADLSFLGKVFQWVRRVAGPKSSEQTYVAINLIE